MTLPMFAAPACRVFLDHVSTAGEARRVRFSPRGLAQPTTHNGSAVDAQLQQPMSYAPPPPGDLDNPLGRSGLDLSDLVIAVFSTVLCVTLAFLGLVPLYNA